MFAITSGLAGRAGFNVVAIVENEEAEANARLIAAAPELLEALEDAEKTLQALVGAPVEHPVLTKVRAVLAKART